MKRKKPISSLRIFFPFFNDAGTVADAIQGAYEIGQKLTDDLEVVAIHGGPSSDSTWAEIQKTKITHPELIIIDRTGNKIGYAVIQWGLKNCSKEWIFYTDGDLQYDLNQLSDLVAEQLRTGADVVNGYKTTRGDGHVRNWIGNAYRVFSRIAYRLPISDLTCDFRLIRTHKIKGIKLNSSGAAILLEMIKKLQLSRATFAQIPVSHRGRTYGKSNYKSLKLLLERIYGDTLVWNELKSYNDQI